MTTETMTRVLKFRAWDKKNKQMRTVAQNDNYFLSFDGRMWGKSWFRQDNGKMTYIGDDFVIQQFTGAYDENKIPIYEGDIVKGRSYDYPAHLKNGEQFDFEGRVEWSNQADDLGLKWVIVSNNNSVWSLGSCCHRNEGYLNGEIIGNIFEANPLNSGVSSKDSIHTTKPECSGAQSEICPDDRACPHCGYDTRIANPAKVAGTGNCNHVYYPENLCSTCQSMRRNDALVKVALKFEETEKKTPATVVSYTMDDVGHITGASVVPIPAVPKGSLASVLKKMGAGVYRSSSDIDVIINSLLESGAIKE